MMERILSSANVKRAWARVKSNGGAPGIDGVTVEDFPAQTREHWAEIRRAILEGRYQPLPVKRCFIPKASGGKRPLGIPCVLDRVIQQAVAQILEPIFDPEFSASSFGFRPGRNAHQALRQTQTFTKAGFDTLVEVDLKSFFDEVNHHRLMNRVSRKVTDKRVLRVIGAYLKAGVWVDGVVEQTTKGVPQGGPLSPLLSNILLHDLDRELERRGHRFARYADDFVICVKSSRAGQRVAESITRFCEKVLKLKVNREKSKVGKSSKCSFLGFTFFSKNKLRWKDAAVEDLKREVRRLTARSWGISIEQRIARLNRYLTGWMNYFGISEYYSPVPELDEWIRRRIRACLWKQWQNSRNRVRTLMQLGAPKIRACVIAGSAKGAWPCSRFLATQCGLTNDYLHNSLKLVSVRDIWIRFHYPN
jgi:RNA-directed DNA polymerase